MDRVWTYLGAVEWVKAKLAAVALLLVHGLDEEVPDGFLAGSNPVEQVVGGMAVPHVVLSGLHCLIVRHVLGALRPLPVELHVCLLLLVLQAAQEGWAELRQAYTLLRLVLYHAGYACEVTSHGTNFTCNCNIKS